MNHVFWNGFLYCFRVFDEQVRDKACGRHVILIRTSHVCVCVCVCAFVWHRNQTCDIDACARMMHMRGVIDRESLMWNV